MARSAHDSQLDARNTSGCGLIYCLHIEWCKTVSVTQAFRPQMYSPLRVCVVC